jgi:hypothetical protein
MKKLRRSRKGPLRAGKHRIGGGDLPRALRRRLEQRFVSRQVGEAEVGLAALLGAEQVASTAEPQVFLGDPKAIIGLPQDFEPRARGLVSGGSRVSGNVRFAPNSRQTHARSVCRLSATSGNRTYHARVGKSSPGSSEKRARMGTHIVYSTQFVYPAELRPWLPQFGGLLSSSTNPYGVR